MASRQRRSFALVLGVLAGGLLAASLALACTPNAEIRVAPSNASQLPATREATVTGAFFVENNEVRIYWNSTTTEPLARVKTDGDGRFTQAVRIPKAPEDTYTIIAVTTDSQGSPWEARAPFTIGRTATKVSGAEKGGGKTGATSGGNGSGKTSATIRGATGGSRGDSGARGSGGADPAPASATTGDSGRDVFAGSVAPGDPASDRQGGGANAGASGSGASERSATGDLWSGFGPGKRSSLAPGAADDAPTSGPGAQLAVGMGLLGLGLVALLTGFGVAAARRRRASAGER